jgi:hypothetical protein
LQKRAFEEGMDALHFFQCTGSRAKLKEWNDKYGNKFSMVATSKCGKVKL